MQVYIIFVQVSAALEFKEDSIEQDNDNVCLRMKSH